MTTKPVRTITFKEASCFGNVLDNVLDLYPRKCRSDRSGKPDVDFPEGEEHGILYGKRIEKKTGMVFKVTFALRSHIVKSQSAEEVTISAYHLDNIRDMVDSNVQLLGFYHILPYAAQEFNKKTSIEYLENDGSSALDGPSALDTSSEFGEGLIDVVFGVTVTSFERFSKAQPKIVGK